ELSQYFLEHIKVTSFGKYANMIIGPFKPGLNVVYGPNEAGKTTINELTKSVLFGWPTVRKNTNSYKPENADRAGSLFFRNTQTGEIQEVKRVKNTETPQTDLFILSDIDKATHDTMFALTSDELMRLDRHTDITSHLLTAGSGTLSSPAHALDEINLRIKEMLSKSANNPTSITNLKIEQVKVREELQQAINQNEQYRQQEIKLKQLQPRKETLEKTQATLNEEIEFYQVQLSKLESLDQSIEEAEKDLEKTIEARNLAQMTQDSQVAEEIVILSNLSQRDEFRLRDILEDLDETRIKLNNAKEHAQKTAEKSRTYRDVLNEDQDPTESKKQQRQTKALQFGLSVAIPIILLAVGIYLLYTASRLGVLSFVIMGSSVILIALLVFVVGMAVSIRPSKAEEKLAEQKDNAAWIAVQDEKALDHAYQEVKNHEIRIREFLDANNMTQAHGSLRRARFMLDQAREYKASLQQAKQHSQALALQEASCHNLLARLRQQRLEVCLQVGLHPSANAYELEQLIMRKKTERDKTMKLSSETNTQVGELSQQLQDALMVHTFDEIKQKNEVIEAQLKQANKKLAMLFLAKRTLETAISDWEKKSQPEVYRQASRIFENMTNGQWKQVRMNPAGEIEVVDAIKSSYSPTVLSMGTKQQLYLSLRIALLMTATNVGKALPIMCDDILVNFDKNRQIKAVQALQELSSVRQVIMFTCHEEVVNLIKEENPTTNLIEL
ncbi:MAG: AAA family ATPase, partial [Anaerotardibacter sp.]